MQLQDKSIVIIGGTSGIGLSAAMACHCEGASLVVVGRDDASLPEARDRLGDEVEIVAADAAHPETAEQAVALAVQRYGRLDGLYHVAGGSARRQGDGWLHELTNEGWSAAIDQNLSSVAYSNRAAVRQFQQASHGGSVLNLTSVLGYSPSPRYFGTIAYATAKAGVIGLTRSAAAAYAAEDIRFNALAPGLTDTPMARRAIDDPEICRFVQGKQPLCGGRAGAPADLDNAAVFFLSDQSRFITGQVLAVDGGWSVTDVV